VRILDSLFGTDGIRGVANEFLTGEFAFKIGLTIAELMSQDGKSGEILIGKDPRISSDMLEHAMAAGFMSRGYNVVSAGIIPTAGLALLTRLGKNVLGVMISASHNQIQDNGLKFFASNGMKLDESVEMRIEEAYNKKLYRKLSLSPLELGSFRDDRSLRSVYVNHLSNIPESRLNGLKIILDTAHGAACHYATEAFASTGADIQVIHEIPDGRKINVDSGSNYPDIVCRMVKENAADMGVAFDGDADRAILIDENGNIVNGDQILAMWGLHLLAHNNLKNNTVVGTVLSNRGLEAILEKHGGRLVRTDVGDKYILRRMVEDDFELGGEQSGHIIFLRHNVTGDGITTALKVADLMRITGKPLSELGNTFIPYPQVAINVPTKDKSSWTTHEPLNKLIDELESEVIKKGNGRLLVRASGTQPLVRIMVEAENENVAKDIANKAADAFRDYFLKNNTLIQPKRR
jgi:phosphoglucosamine mutase